MLFSRCCVMGYHRCCPETLSQATIAALSTAFQAGWNVWEMPTWNLNLDTWILKPYNTIPRPCHGITSLLSWDIVPGYHRCALYCLPGRETCWVIACLKPDSWYLNPETIQYNHETLSRDNIAISPRLRPRLPSLRSVLSSRQGDMSGSCMPENWNNSLFFVSSFFNALDSNLLETSELYNTFLLYYQLISMFFCTLMSCT